jgi:hypothetical protein
MKAIFCKAVLAAVLAASSVLSVQRDWIANQPSREESGDRFIQMMREQPTASGPMTDEEQSESLRAPKNLYKPPIQLQREEYGH